MTDLVREGRLFRVVGFNPSHRQLYLASEALAIDRTTTRVEVYIGHVELMLLKPFYRDGVHVRRASPEEFAVLRERHRLEAADAEYTWMLEPDGDSFVVGGRPSWREAEYEAMGDREALYDASLPWPPEFPAQWGTVG
ncbi:hypothetical protein [Streptomyces acidiscabies]|uniref:Uncharacterized protein n=1 Tax=Streptomyces acidiscabies TaxID=42234 RepID=A0AAP6BFS3_9ACTN|nr:hypothetical protein [Streptomyces acidiscabies]MBP5936838.1 hypothetical protein [Streptomyces sp. LBUM 1476]MBZ3915149.1 hypothetical protein [Streptomyces acidiscabies]MDX2963652.1 hypothetical protein [Streptomyces acidiscabies]MDX3021211.1 hypothetical protein [Streptomyces acidiscabies]MDX3793536.1 hypothetical protein [Streptomyces acidiscabies]